MYEFHLDVTPPEAYFLAPCEKRIQSSHTLRNTCQSPIAVKIKCTNNRDFRVHPVYASIPPKESRNIVITRGCSTIPPETDRKERVIIEYMEDTDGENTRDLFQTHAPQKKEKVDLIITDKLLRLNPRQATFFSPYDKIRRSRHTLINSSPDQRIAYKVKCSSRDRYKIRPVFGILKPEDSHPLYITRLEGPCKDKGMEKLQIIFMGISNDAEDAKTAFQRAAPEALKSIEIPLIDSKKPELDISPSKLSFHSSRLTQQVKSARLSNLTTFYRFAIKVRCSDNKQFRVCPVFAVAEPEGRCEFTVTRGATPFDGLHSHQLQFLYAELPPNTDDQDLQGFFKTAENVSTVKLELALDETPLSVDRTQSANASARQRSKSEK